MVNRQRYRKHDEKKRKNMKSLKILKRSIKRDFKYFIIYFCGFFFLLHGINYYLRSREFFYVLLSILGAISIITGSYLSSAAQEDEFTQMKYGFDFDKEFKLYSSSYTKKKKNNNKSFMSYSEWKNHIVNDYKKLIGKEDFFRFLIAKARGLKLDIEQTKAIYIPLIAVIIAAFSIYSSKMDGSTISLLITIMAFITGLSNANGISKDYRKLYFIEDLIEIMFPEKAKNSEDKKY